VDVGRRLIGADRWPIDLGRRLIDVVRRPIDVDRQLMVVAAVHAAVSALHGGVHVQAAVTLASWQAAVVAVTVLGPFFVAAVAGRWRRAAGFAFAALLVASVVFGVAHHWLLAGVDNVENVGHGHRGPFEASAAVLAVVGVWGARVGYDARTGD
jgi:hypothetical protein